VVGLGEREEGRVVEKSRADCVDVEALLGGSPFLIRLLKALRKKVLISGSPGGRRSPILMNEEINSLGV